MYKKLYLKSLELAAHKSSEFYLALVSFIESSFFPIPPDVMIVPMVMARKDRFIRIFLNATIFSVLGGIFGYFIGFIFSDLAISVVEFYNYEDKVNNLKARLSEGSGLYIWLITLFLAGFTPLPFKVFTITSGLISFNIFIFIIICLISRGLRFFIVSYFTFRFGEPFVNFIEKKGALWSTVVGFLLIPLFILIYCSQQSGV